MSKLWFKRKKYGWGWVPASVEGWLVLAVYALFLVGYTVLADAKWFKFSSLIFSVVTVGSSAGLIFICYKKGEAPRWQWGDKEVIKKEKD